MTARSSYARTVETPGGPVTLTLKNTTNAQGFGARWLVEASISTKKGRITVPLNQEFLRSKAEALALYSAATSREINEAITLEQARAVMEIGTLTVWEDAQKVRISEMKIARNAIGSIPHSRRKRLE